MSETQRIPIGEFSKATGLSIKTLRFYHEEGILTPSSVDPSSGYRYYDDRCIERARVIRLLRDFEFSVEDIRTLLADCSDEGEALEHLVRHRKALAERVRHARNTIGVLDRLIRRESEARKIAAASSFAVARRTVDPVLIAGVRMRGRYEDCGRAFAKIGRALGRHIAGAPLCLYYDGEYREEDVDFEACFPVRRQVKADGIEFRTLEGAACLSLIHRGPYLELGRSYEKILREARRLELEVALPTREVYLKGPGLIFKGRPTSYLTELLFPIGS